MVVFSAAGLISVAERFIEHNIGVIGFPVCGGQNQQVLPPCSKGKGTAYASMLTSHPVANAPALTQFITLEVRCPSDLSVSLRVVNMTLVYAGITFATLGASRIAAWIRSVSRIC